MFDNSIGNMFAGVLDSVKTVDTEQKQEFSCVETPNGDGTSTYHKICAYCGKSFDYSAKSNIRENFQRKFCSDECRKLSDREKDKQYRNKLKTMGINRHVNDCGNKHGHLNFDSNGNWIPTEKVCAFCGKTYMPKDYQHQSNRYKFCSKECLHKYHSVHKRQSIDGYDRVCVICGKKFHTNQFQKKTCSDECASANRYKMSHKSMFANREINIRHAVCQHCGKEFDTYNIHKVFCSDACRKRHHLKCNGYNNHNIGELQTYTAVCKNCGKEFTFEGQPNLSKRFMRACCSDECRKELSKKQEYIHNRTKRIGYSLADYGISDTATVDEIIKILKDTKKRTVVCKHCGKTFETDNAVRKFCSSECSSAYNIAHGLKPFCDYVRKPKETRICKRCGKEFKTSRTTGKHQQTYCSKECRMADIRDAVNAKNRAKHQTFHRTCPICGTEFDTRLPKKMYCSHACKRIGERNKYYEEHGVAEFTITCKHCGKEFVTHNKFQKYCSSECKTAYHLEHYVHHEVLPRTCEKCGKIFTPAKHHPHQRFCSKECRGDYIPSNIEIEPRACEQCGKMFTPSKTHPYQKFCSKECQRINQYQKNHSPINREPRACKQCGKMFTPSKTHPHYEFCSQDCKKEHILASLPVLTLICKQCGNEFHSHRKDRKYCSKACKDKAFSLSKSNTPIEKTCPICGKTFVTTHSAVKYCSEECRYRAKLDHNNYYNHTHKEDRNERNRNNYRYCERREVTTTCKYCGKEFTYTLVGKQLERSFCSQDCSKRYHKHKSHTPKFLTLGFSSYEEYKAWLNAELAKTKAQRETEKELKRANIAREKEERRQKHIIEVEERKNIRNAEIEARKQAHLIEMEAKKAKHLMEVEQRRIVRLAEIEERKRIKAEEAAARREETIKERMIRKAQRQREHEKWLIEHREEIEARRKERLEERLKKNAERRAARKEIELEERRKHAEQMVSEHPDKYVLKTSICHVCGREFYYADYLNGNGVVPKICSEACKYILQKERAPEYIRRCKDKAEKKCVIITTWRGNRCDDVHRMTATEIYERDMDKYICGYNVETTDVTLRYTNPKLWKKMNKKSQSKVSLSELKKEDAEITEEQIDRMNQQALKDAAEMT